VTKWTYIQVDYHRMEAKEALRTSFNIILSYLLFLQPSGPLAWLPNGRFLDLIPFNLRKWVLFCWLLSADPSFLCPHMKLWPCFCRLRDILWRRECEEKQEYSLSQRQLFPPKDSGCSYPIHSQSHRNIYQVHIFMPKLWPHSKSHLRCEWSSKYQ